MGKPERKPADYDSWQAWQDARQRDGKMPVIAKPVAYVVPVILVVLVLSWFVIDWVGGTLDDEVRRTGSAVMVEDCRRSAPHFRCPASISWGGDESDTGDVYSTEPLSGTVEVEERLSFQPERRGRSSRNKPQVWAADHTPNARPWLFPVVYGAVGVGSLVLGGVVIAKGSTVLKRRSQAEWAGARRAAGKSW